MKTPTFREQYDKIVKAYLRDELEPLNSCACFIGNMFDGNWDWCGIRPGNQYFGENGYRLIADAGYDRSEILGLEANFLHMCRWPDGFSAPPSEESLYEAMESTILMLKKIHESKGEVVEDYVFEKRQLSEIHATK